jgi:hypothetical protein
VPQPVVSAAASVAEQLEAHRAVASTDPISHPFSKQLPKMVDR